MIEKLRLLLEKNQFKGYDPYDALTSPVLSSLSLNNKYFRILFIQLLKKSPINFRPVLFVRQEVNPKGLGLILWGYVKLFRNNGDESLQEKISQLLDLLDEVKTVTGSGHGWGYNFDWQSRAFFLPKFTPTTVNSAFIGHALLDTFAVTGNEKALHLALPIADFILTDLNRLAENDSICFSYTSLDEYFVHNANLLGASLLIRLYKFNKNEELKNIAVKSLNYSMNHQQKDGSWFYAEKESSHWIDSFHTGFNLQAIRYFIDEGYGGVYEDAFEKGVRFYADHFFLPDGTPKYYHDKVYPIDIHSAAQAIAFFSGMGTAYHEFTEKILNWTLDNMRHPEGHFYFQKQRFYTNKIPYMRWSQAWMFHALTENLANNPATIS